MWELENANRQENVCALFAAHHVIPRFGGFVHFKQRCPAPSARHTPRCRSSFVRPIEPAHWQRNAEFMWFDSPLPMPVFIIINYNNQSIFGSAQFVAGGGRYSGTVHNIFPYDLTNGRCRCDYVFWFMRWQNVRMRASCMQYSPKVWHWPDLWRVKFESGRHLVCLFFFQLVLADGLAWVSSSISVTGSRKGRRTGRVEGNGE